MRIDATLQTTEPVVVMATREAGRCPHPSLPTCLLAV
jgi:hypothetical protein